jgi:hypothetical protein
VPLPVDGGARRVLVANGLGLTPQMGWGTKPALRIQMCMHAYCAASAAPGFVFVWAFSVGFSLCFAVASHAGGTVGTISSATSTRRSSGAPVRDHPVPNSNLKWNHQFHWFLRAVAHWFSFNLICPQLMLSSPPDLQRLATSMST